MPLTGHMNGNILEKVEDTAVVSKKFGKRDIAVALLCAIVIVAAVALAGHGIISVLPCMVALLLCVFARKAAIIAVVTAFAAAAAMYFSFDPGAGWADLNGNGIILRALALAMSYFGVRLLSLAGADKVVLQIILDNTQSRRGYLAAASLLSMVFSASPELGCLISGSIFAKAGERLGVSREKTAFLVNISSVMLWCLIGIGIYADPLFEYVRMGLDIAGGQSVSAAEFLRTTIVFLYFPICITVVLMMSVFKLRDTGGMLKIEREQRKRCNVEQLKNIYKSETDRGEVGMVVVPLLLDVLAMLGTIAAGLETDVSMLISSGIFLISVTASVLAKRGIRILIGVLSIKINRILPIMLISALIIRFILTGPAPFSLVGIVINENLPLWLLPLITIIVSALIALVSGNAIIAMALVLPSAIPASWLASEQAIYYTMATASAISGALAGQLCAPHAITSVISACACGCSMRTHLKTQVPYVLLSLGISCLFGYLPISLGLTAPFGLLCSIMGSYALFETISKSPDTRSRKKDDN